MNIERTVRIGKVDYDLAEQNFPLKFTYNKLLEYYQQKVKNYADQLLLKRNTAAPEGIARNASIKAAKKFTAKWTQLWPCNEYPAPEVRLEVNSRAHLAVKTLMKDESVKELKNYVKSQQTLLNAKLEQSSLQSSLT